MDGFNQALKDSLGDCVTPVKDIDDAYRFFKKASEVLQEKKYMVSAIKELSALKPLK
jgi:hypothetical protein